MQVAGGVAEAVELFSYYAPQPLVAQAVVEVRSVRDSYARVSCFEIRQR